jgi:hypothetical protein
VGGVDKRRVGAPSRWTVQPGAWRTTGEESHVGGGDDGNAEAPGDKPDPAARAKAEANWREILPRAEHLAVTLRDMNDGLGIRTPRGEWEYCLVREWLMAVMQQLGACWGIETGKRAGAVYSWIERAVDEAFPRSLADRFEVSDWRLYRWLEFRRLVLTLFARAGFDPSTPAADGDADMPNSTARRARGRPRGGERCPEYYREHWLALRDELDRRPKQDEFLRYLDLIRLSEQGNHGKPSPREIRECLSNPDPHKFDRGTLKGNLKPKYWPWDVFVAWAEAADRTAS